MKKFLKYTCFMLLACFLAAGLFSGRAEAATSRKTLFTIDENSSSFSKSASVDVSGDNVKDTVKLKLTVENSVITGFKIYVAGKLAYSAEAWSYLSNWRATLGYVKLNDQAEYLDFYIDNTDIAYMSCHVLLQYSTDSKKLTLIKDLCEGWGAVACHSKVSSVGSSYLYVTYTADPFTIGELNYKVKYTLKSGKLSASTSCSKVSSGYTVSGTATDGLEVLFSENLFQAAEPLKLTTTAGGSTTAFNARKYDILQLTKLKLRTNDCGPGFVFKELYGYFTRGSKGGWLMLGGFSIAKSPQYESEYFRGVTARQPVPVAN